MAKTKAAAAGPAANGGPSGAAATADGDNKPIRNLYLVDGSGYLFRAYHALPPMTRPDGTPINAVYGFCRMLVADLLDKPEVDHIAMILDASETTFRKEIYDKYKANRPPPPDDLIPQFPLIREAAKAFNVTVCELDGFEADDLIATYARLAVEAGATCTIVSSDKDLMQLIRPGVEMMDPIKKTKIGPAEVMEKFGVAPNKVVDVQALAGDSTDNVPGVPGIGVKTAAQLITEYGDLEALLTRAGEIKQPKRREALQQNAELARISLKLVTLRDDVPPPADPDSFDKRKPDPNVLLPWLEQQGFKSLLQRFRGELGEASDPVAPAVPSVQPALPPPTPKTAPVRPRSNRPFTQADYELIQDEKTLDEWIARLKPLLEDPSVLKVGQNIKYDMAVLRRYGIEIGPVDDTMLLSFVLDAGKHNHGMDELAELYLGQKTIKFSDVAGSGAKQVSFDKVPIDKARDYAAEDADVTMQLWAQFKTRLATDRMVGVYETIERPLIAVLLGMEQAGIKVDAPQLKRLSAEFEKRMAELELEIHKVAGRPFNVGSPKQLGEILFDEQKLPGGRRNKNGSWATDVSILEDLAAQGHALPVKIMEHRQIAKLKGTYTDALVRELDARTGRVHTSYQMTGAATGRLASTDPNLQNIPVRTEEGRKIREAFIAEQGHKLLSADYSQIELRLLAHVADIASLKEAFARGDDIHAITASEMFGVPVKGMDPLVRRRAKAINFGIIYGISAFGLANQLGIGQPEAREYIGRYFQRYPGIRDYMETTKAYARKHGYVKTPFGRKVHLRFINDKSQGMRAFAERASINAPLQGGAADIIKKAMIRLPGALTSAGLTGRMLLQVHDELLFEVPVAEIDKTKDVARRVMEGAATLSVPLVVETGVGDNWAAAH